jgi:hypothetical protein
VGLQTTGSPHTAQTVPGPGRPYTGTRGAPRGIREAQSNPRMQALEGSERPVRAARRGVEGELHRVQHPPHPQVTATPLLSRTVHPGYVRRHRILRCRVFLHTPLQLGVSCHRLWNTPGTPPRSRAMGAGAGGGREPCEAAQVNSPRDENWSMEATANPAKPRGTHA